MYAPLQASYEAALPYLDLLDVVAVTFGAKETSGEEIPMIAGAIGPDREDRPPG